MTNRWLPLTVAEETELDLSVEQTAILAELEYGSSGSDHLGSRTDMRSR